MYDNSAPKSNDESTFIPNWLSLPAYVFEMVILQLDWTSTVNCRRVCKDWNELIEGLNIEKRIENNWFNSSPSLDQEHIHLEFHNNPPNTIRAGILYIGEDVRVIIRKEESGRVNLKSQIQVIDESQDNHPDGKTWTIDVSLRGTCSFADILGIEVTETLVVLKCTVNLSPTANDLPVKGTDFLDIWSRKGRSHISVVMMNSMDMNDVGYVKCSKSTILIFEEDTAQFSTIEVRDDESMKTTTYITPTRLLEADDIEIKDFKPPYALIETHGQEYFTTTGLVHCEIITEEAKMEEKLFVDISKGHGATIYDAKMISNYITYCQCLPSPSFNVMDLNGNNILTLKLFPIPIGPSNIILENIFFQSGKLMFIEGEEERYIITKLVKLHVFDINSLVDNYEKNGKLMCSPGDHESQTEFKSRSVSLQSQNISYNDDTADDEVTIISDKVSVSLYISSRSEMVARKYKLSFWNE